MGKVLSKFNNGFPGAVSRVKDDVIVSLKNAGQAPIKFGDPVFLYNSVTPGGVRGFIAGTTTENEFVGFAVRVPDKSPEVFSGNAGEFSVGDPVDVLVRGCTVVPCGTAAAKIGNPVYIRKNDSVIVTNAGAEGTTVPLPDTHIREPRDSAGNVEIVITKRHLQ